jgi:hypothetical protein
MRSSLKIISVGRRVYLQTIKYLTQKLRLRSLISYTKKSCYNYEVVNYDVDNLKTAHNRGIYATDGVFILRFDASVIYY